MSVPPPPLPAGTSVDEFDAGLTQLGATIRASDIFVFRRVANARFVHVGGLGRGETWAGDIELDADTDPLASQVRVDRPLRIRHQETQHVFGPYYAVAAAAVRLSDDVLVIFGATEPGSDFDRSAAELSAAAKQSAELVDAVTPAKHLADELEVLHACQDLATRNRPGGSVEDAMSHAATVAADVLGCEIALMWLPDGRLHRHVSAELPARAAPVEHFAQIMRALWEERETLPRCVQDATAQPLASPLDPASGVRSYFAVPIGDPATALLWVAHTRVRPRGFTELCVDLGTQLAATASAGLATATLREQLLHAVVEETSAREELARVNTELGRAALHDPLTGLPNRVLLQRHVELLGNDQQPGRSVVTRSEPAPVLLYIDLDDFKSVNDEHGHAVGDGVLVEFARRLRESCRPNDVAARLAGDEFALLMVDPLTEEHAVAVANRVVRAASIPFLVADRVVAIGASVGVASVATVRRGADDLPALETLLH
nr:sensor domain-containing diguanylate cyclase [Actinomycetota bacterium]